MKSLALIAITLMFSSHRALAGNKKKPNHPLDPPVNNHGIQPTVYIKEETLFTSLTYIGVIPIVSTEWSISFDVRLLEHITANWNTIIRFTSGGAGGADLPSVWVKPSTSELIIKSAVNGNLNTLCLDGVVYNIAIDKLTHIEIHQRYIGNGSYKFVVSIDGVEMKSIINNGAQQFHNVRITAGGFGKKYISNFEHTNFL